MFDKSTHFKQVCQLLLSVIVGLLVVVLVFTNKSFLFLYRNKHSTHGI